MQGRDGGGGEPDGGERSPEAGLPACRDVAYGRGAASEAVETRDRAATTGARLRDQGAPWNIKDYYQIMGVGRDASADDIKRALTGSSRASITPTSARKRTPKQSSRKSARRMRSCATPRSARPTTRWARAQARRGVPPAARLAVRLRRHARRTPACTAISSSSSSAASGPRPASDRSGAAGSTRRGQVEVTLEEAFRGTERRLSLQRVAVDERGPRAADGAAVERADPGRRRRRAKDQRAVAGRAAAWAGARPATCSSSAIAAAPLVPRRRARHPAPICP